MNSTGFLRVAATAVIILNFVVKSEAVADGEPASRWSLEKAAAWNEEHGWLVGCNYIPSTAINQLEMWQADSFDVATIKKELAWAEALGFNSLRVYLHNLLWVQDADGFLRRMEIFLDICDSHGLGVQFVLLDGVWDPFPKVGKQRDPKPHVHNSGWLQSPGVKILKDPSRHEELKPYIQGVIGHFCNDRRIHSWDLFNEPDNRNIPAYVKHEPGDKEALVLRLLKNVFAWARQSGPTQPLTAGVWHGDWSSDKTLSELSRYMLEQSDVISFHCYSDLKETRLRVEQLKRYQRPILCTEYMARPANSTFESILPYFKKQNVGAYNWGFVSGKSQTIYPWDSWTKTYTDEPPLWFHDILHKGGTPYREQEVKVIRSLTGKQSGTYKNPVISENLADPTVLFHDGTYYLYATGGIADYRGYKVWTSKDLVQWEGGTVVFKSSQPNAWAPDVWRDPSTGRVYLYYTVNHTVGVASADHPCGPFTETRKLVDSSIDAHLFQDEDGKLYLYYVQLAGFKITVQPMSSPTEPAGKAKVVLAPKSDWETRAGHVTEGPWIIKKKGVYYMLYSGSGADTPEYAVGYATASNPMGPFTRAPHNPILKRSENLWGPGHGCAVQDDEGRWWFIYHQKQTAQIGWDRFICLDPLWFDQQDNLYGRASRAELQSTPRVFSGQSRPREFDPFVWISAVPANCPFEQSEELAGIEFSGKYRHYPVADTWYPTWAADGNLYSPWTDGELHGENSYSDALTKEVASFGGFRGIPGKAATGQAVMIGDDPRNLTLKSLGRIQADPFPYGGRYPCGSLILDDIWYYGTYCLSPSGQTTYGDKVYNWPWLGPLVGFRTSTDLGQTWTETPHTPQEPLFGETGMWGHPLKIGAPHFVDFGKNMEHSPDGLAYLLAQGAELTDPEARFENLSWITADQIYLLRVKPSLETINDSKAYEFFAGHDKQGRPRWTKDFDAIQPLLEWNNHMGCVTATYVASLQKYLMWVTDGGNTCARMNTYVLEADGLTGPWRLVSYFKDFGEQAYFVNLPSKFIQPDGYSAWLCYSGNFATDWNNEKIVANPPGSRYGLVLQEIRFLHRN